MTEPYRDIVWSPPMRQRGAVAPPGGAVDPASSKWPPNATGMIHPAVVSHFKASDAFSPLSPSVTPPGAYSMTMTKPSLFLLGFGLMLLGVCFFSSGFFLGLWMGRGSSGEGSAQVAGGGEKGRVLPGMGSLLEIVGAAGGNTGRLAYATQRALNKDSRHSVKTAEKTRGGGRVDDGGGAHSASTAHANARERDSRGDVGEGRGGPFGDTNHAAREKSPSGATYAVELGTYATKENALDLLERLRSRSFSVYLVESKGNDGFSLFCVRLGNFSDFLMAETAAAEIPSDQERVTPIVVEVKSTDKRLTQP